MASNQVSNQRRQGSTGQAPQQGHQSSGSGTNFRQEAERSFGSLSNVASHASDYWERGEDQMRQLVRDREGTAILVAVATGLGIGLLIGASLGRSRREELTWRERINAEGFGKRLMQRIESMIPEAVSEHFGR
jgi:hypothetical protein